MTLERAGKTGDADADPIAEAGAGSAVLPERMFGAFNIGTRLKHARMARGLRLKDVGKAAHCSESLVSKLENNRIQPSLNVLYRICEALGLTFGELFATPEPQGIVREGERVVVELDHVRRGQGIRLERLIPQSRGHLLQGYVHVVAPGGGSEGLITHEGEEVAYVLEGEVEILLGEDVYRLGAGDSFCYRSEVPHGYRNVGAGESRIIFINTPPTF